jgi:rhodanese-related sulfurtransferase
VSRQEVNGPITTVDELLEAARARLHRLTTLETYTAVARGSALIDIRTDGQRSTGGLIAEARHIHRNVLEWRLDPSSPDRDPELAIPGRHVILICKEGYQSSLAAATLRDFGIDATDVIGGFHAWRASGLPTVTAAIDAVPRAFDNFASTAKRTPADA